MTYSAVYCALISKRLNNPIEKGSGIYVEKHHIIPKSEGGDESDDNLVNLTAREHYVAHLLLAKIYNDQKMWCAIHRLVYGNNKNYTRITSRLYSKIKAQFVKKMSETMRGRKMPPRSEEYRRKQSEAQKGKIMSEESRRKMSEAKQKMSADTRRKISEAKSGRKLSEDHKINLSKAMNGRVFSEEHRRKLSEAKKGKPSIFKGKHHSEETKRKISESKKHNAKNIMEQTTSK